jgi:NAD(P)-dependent dehydrogenase (short-subunit alcohol dehydrogenase family)
MSLANRTAVITGATGGLGSVLTRDLAAQGANVALLERDQAKLDAFVETLGLPSSRYLTRVVNLLDLAETKAAADAVIAQFGRVDILLHVVGGWTGGKSVADTETSDLEFMLNQHVWTSFNVTKTFVPHLLANKWGRIIMVTSPFASRPMANGAPYAMAKAGQEALMMTLSEELKNTGVTANMFHAKAIDMKHEKESAPTKDNASWVTPEEISAVVQYLVSDAAAIMNGARLPMYGSY